MLSVLIPDVTHRIYHSRFMRKCHSCIQNKYVHIVYNCIYHHGKHFMCIRLVLLMELIIQYVLSLNLRATMLDSRDCYPMQCTHGCSVVCHPSRISVGTMHKRLTTQKRRVQFQFLMSDLCICRMTVRITYPNEKH